MWQEYSSRIGDLTVDQIKTDYPFTAFVMYKKQEEGSDELVDPFKVKSDSKNELISVVKALYEEIIASLFDDLSKLQALETIRNENQRSEYIVNVHA